MEEVRVEDLENTQDCFFHFAPKKVLQSIEQQGLVASIGGASKVIDEQEKRVYLSKGIKGALAIKNSFIYKLSQMSIREIPEEYRPYFGYASFDSDERIPREDVFKAYAERMKEEVYLLVDAKEGEDFYEEDINQSLSGVSHDIKGKPNHDIEPEKLRLLTTPEGSSAYDVVKRFYEIVLEFHKDNPNLVNEMNYSLYEMFEYVEHGRLQEVPVEQIGRQVVERYKEPETVEIEQYDQGMYESMKEMFGVEMAEKYRASTQTAEQGER